MPTQPTLSADTKAKLDAILKEHVGSGAIPAKTFAVATANDDSLLYFNAVGNKVYGEPDKGTIGKDTLMQLMSMTKFVTSLAALQLVEQGKLSFDDPAIIEKHLPELCALGILTGLDSVTNEPQYTKRQVPITLRHLLTHTSGCSYHMMEPTIAKWVAATGSPVWCDPNPTVKALEHPLLFEPGTHWKYGLSADWVSVLVERVSGQAMEDYCRKNIFDPVHADSVTFFPGKNDLERLQALLVRAEDGSLQPLPPPRDLSPEKVKGLALGGTGLFGTPRDFLRILQGVLRCAQPGKGNIVSPATFALLFQDALPESASAPGNPIRKELNELAGTFNHPDPAHVAEHSLTHSHACMLTTKDSVHGRKAYTGWWEGIFKTFFWIDPTSGITGVCCTQVYSWPNPDEPYDRVFNELERTLYDGLEA